MTAHLPAGAAYRPPEFVWLVPCTCGALVTVTDAALVRTSSSTAAISEAFFAHAEEMRKTGDGEHSRQQLTADEGDR